MKLKWKWKWPRSFFLRSTDLQLTDFMDEDEYNDFLFFHEYPEELIKQSDVFLFYIETLREKIYFCKTQLNEIETCISEINIDDTTYIRSYIQSESINKIFLHLEEHIMQNKTDHDYFVKQKRKITKEIKQLEQLLYEHYFHLHNRWNKAYANLVLKKQYEKSLGIRRYCICGI